MLQQIKRVFCIKNIIILIFLGAFCYVSSSFFHKDKVSDAAEIVTPTEEEIAYLQSIGRNGIINLRVHDNSGLGNRLIKIVSFLRYYQPKHLNLYWKDTGWVSAKFSDLFDVSWNTTVSEFNDEFSLSIHDADKTPLFPYICNWGFLVTARDFKTTEPFIINRQYNRIPQEIRNIYLPYFEKIKPSKVVQARINELNLPTKFIPVQVRNHHDWYAYFWAKKSVQDFFDVMDKYPDDTIFYLSAMSKEIADEFYERYPERIIELPHKDYTSMVDAVADMFVIGSQDEAIYAYGSSFPEVAWWLGGAKANVTIVGNDEGWRVKIETFPILDRIY